MRSLWDGIKKMEGIECGVSGLCLFCSSHLDRATDGSGEA